MEAPVPDSCESEEGRITFVVSVTFASRRTPAAVIEDPAATVRIQPLRTFNVHLLLKSTGGQHA